MGSISILGAGLDMIMTSSEYESGVVLLLEEWVGELPEGTATLTVKQLAGKYEHPDFEVKPTNSRASSFRGYAVRGDLTLYVGQHSEVELFNFERGGSVVPHLTWQEEFRLIWKAVIKGGYTEKCYRSRDGKIVRCRTEILLDGVPLILGFSVSLRPKWLLKECEVAYEPYIKMD
jgi:hypothetical protein